MILPVGSAPGIWGIQTFEIYDLVGNDTGKVSNAEMFQFARDLNFDRIDNRQQLLNDFDRIQQSIDASKSSSFGVHPMNSPFSKCSMGQMQGNASLCFPTVPV